jgi:hypothetical protein
LAFAHEPIATIAPRIQIPVEDTLETLHNALLKRTVANRVLEEGGKKMLIGEDYKLIRVDLNNTPFLQLIGADNTKAGIHYRRVKFGRYSRQVTIPTHPI